MIVFSGPSSVGKNVAIEALRAQYGVRFGTPVTSRAPRKEEKPGEDYHFVGTPGFQARIREDSLDEWDFALNHYYGFPAGTFKAGDPPFVTHSLARMALRLRRRFEGVVLIFLRPADAAEQVRRVEARFPDAEERRMRLSHWREELTHACLFDHQIDIGGGRDVLDARHEPFWRALGIAA